MLISATELAVENDLVTRVEIGEEGDTKLESFFDWLTLAFFFF